VPPGLSNAPWSAPKIRRRPTSSGTRRATGPPTNGDR